jgi:hypothetical protein
VRSVAKTGPRSRLAVLFSVPFTASLRVRPRLMADPLDLHATLLPATSSTNFCTDGQQRDDARTPIRNRVTRMYSGSGSVQLALTRTKLRSDCAGAHVRSTPSTNAMSASGTTVASLVLEETNRANQNEPPYRLCERRMAPRSRLQTRQEETGRVPIRFGPLPPSCRGAWPRSSPG